MKSTIFFILLYVQVNSTLTNFFATRLLKQCWFCKFHKYLYLLMHLELLKGIFCSF